MVTPRELGKLFKETRENKKLDIDTVAKKSRIPITIIHEFENGIFDRIGKIYTRSFIKKYSEFLGLNPEDMLAKFESVAENINEREFSFTVEEEDDKAERSKGIPAFSNKNIQIALIGGLSILLIVLLFVLIGSIKAKLSSKKAKSVSVRVVKPVRTPTRTTAPNSDRTAQESKATAGETKSGAIDLQLKATGEVWVKVMEADEQVFVGTLKEGESIIFNSDVPLTVWSGKAERLVLIVNDHKVGAVAAGVVKDIEVNEKGVKVNGNWVIHL